MGYPKKLYFGTVKNRKMKTVLNDYDEQQLRSQGWVDFAQLGKGNDGSQSTAQPIITQPSAECAELQQNYEQLQSNYEQLQSNYEQLQIEHEQLKLTNVSLNERLQELSSSTTSVYDSWTVRQLQDELSRRGVSFNRGANKVELIRLLVQNDEFPPSD